MAGLTPTGWERLVLLPLDQGWRPSELHPGAHSVDPLQLQRAVVGGLQPRWPLDRERGRGPHGEDLGGAQQPRIS